MKRTNTIKPNGLPTGTHIISIDDGFAEWSFIVKVRGDKSISQMYDIIRRAFRARKHSGVIRRRFKHDKSILGSGVTRP